jgi:hypothetical protein
MDRDKQVAARVSASIYLSVYPLIRVLNLHFASRMAYFRFNRIIP